MERQPGRSVVVAEFGRSSDESTILFENSVASGAGEIFPVAPGEVECSIHIFISMASRRFFDHGFNHNLVLPWRSNSINARRPW